MLIIAYLVGLFSYVILLLGISSQLHYFLILSLSSLLLFFVAVLLFPKRKKVVYFVKNSGRSELFLVLLLIVTSVINFIGALGPELSFDALWYHLTIPKLYILHHKIYFIHGNLLYYNAQPKLTEMLYAAALILGDEVWAKIIHFSFGLLLCFALYKLARLYINKFWSLVSVLLFYSNLVVGWLSISAYTDLTRAFYETFALFYILRYSKEKKGSYLVHSALLLGFAISAKVISLISIPVFIIIILLIENSWITRLRKIMLFCFLSLLVPLPWFILSFINTNNPIYPLFSSAAPIFSLSNLNPVIVVKNIINVFLFSSDPINPLYLIFLPVIIASFYKINKKYKALLLFGMLSLFFWYCSSFLGFWHGTMDAGSARFLTSYLPAYSLICIIALSSVRYSRIRTMGILLILAVAIINGGYRFAANFRYIPYIVGSESKERFLMKNLNFSFGDFYDEKQAIKKIVGDNLVEIVNVHNLFYVDFPFTLKEFKDGTKPAYFLVQHGSVPNNYKYTKIVYQNKKTGVILYKL